MRMKKGALSANLDITLFSPETFALFSQILVNLLGNTLGLRLCLKTGNALSFGLGRRGFESLCNWVILAVEGGCTHHGWGREVMVGGKGRAGGVKTSGDSGMEIWVAALIITAMFASIIVHMSH